MKSAPKSAPLKLLDTKNLAQDILARFAAGSVTKSGETRNSALVIGLYGDLGAGKTTFMQFFGEALGVKEKLLSPTFVIEKIYKIDSAANPSVSKNFDHLIHIDAYRIEDPKEMLTLGWEEIVKNPRNIICVEWADKIAAIMPKDHVTINFSHHDEESRVITLE